MRRSKRVSFHQEVTVKEFIKKQGNSSVESDISSPDLYRAPINHRGQDVDGQVSGDDSSMELTEIISKSNNSGFSSDDSNMDLTDVSLPGQGELTMMINKDKREYVNNVSLLGDCTEVVNFKAVANEMIFDNLDMSLNTTSKGSYRNLDSLARKMLPGNANFNNSVNVSHNLSHNVSHNVSNMLDESESSSVRRSLRIAKRSSEGGDTPQFKTPQVNLQKKKNKGGSLSRSKQKKNVSLLSSANSTYSRSFSNVSKMPSINLLENSGEGSDISLLSNNDSIAEKQAVEKQERHNQLIQLRDEKLAQLKKQDAEIVMWETKIKEVEEKLKVTKKSHAHSYAVGLLGLLEGC